MSVMVKQRRIRRIAFRSMTFAIMFLSPLLLFAASGKGVEIRSLGLLDIDASFTARYQFDDQERGTDSTSSSFEKRTTWEEEFFLMTKSYVYHPGFLNMEIGGGPLFVQQQFDSNGGSNDNDEILFNGVARLNFLDLKNYPFSLYVQRSHPSITTSLSGRFLTEQNEYGFSGRLKKLGKSTSVMTDLSHLDSKGSGFDSVVDEDIDRASLKVETGFRDGDRITLEHNQFTRSSASGSPGLPIQSVRTRQRNSNLQVRNLFGSDDQYRLHQSFRWFKQDTESTFLSEVDSRNYNAALRLQHSETFRTFAGYRFSETGRPETVSRNHSADAGFYHSISEKFRYGASLDHAIEQQTGFDRDRSGINGSINYSIPTSFGSINLGGSIRQARTDQKSEATTVLVFDETVTLNDTTPVEFANDFVVTASVVVTNVPGTQVFVEGFDYRLVEIGSVTSIQRLLGSNIFDGQTVLIDYEYRTSGTAMFDTLSSGLNVSLNLLKYINVGVHYNLRDTDVKSGELTMPINDQEMLELVIGAELPVGRRWTLGGELRHADQNEDISPFVQDSFSLSASTSLRGSLRLNLSASMFRIDREQSIEDVDQVSYRLGLSGRAWRRVQLRYDTAYLRDTGGSLPREQLQHRLHLQWRYRMVRFFLRAVHSEDMLGVSERSSTRITAEVERVF